jgi:surface protein
MNISKKRSCKNYKKLKSPNLCNKNIIYYIIILIIEIDLIRSNSYCQIDIKINGQGDQDILFQYSIQNYDGESIEFYYSPDEIYINDILQNYTGKRVKNLTNEINNISMIFHTKLLYLTGMFANLNKITEIDFSKCDTSLVTNMEFTFYKCSSLVLLNLDNFNTSSVNSLICAFQECSSLKNLNLDYFDTSSVTNMIAVFKGCSSLTSLKLSNFKTSKVNKMEDMFANCKSLISLNLNNFDTSLVTNMTSSFLNVIHCNHYILIILIHPKLKVLGICFIIAFL